MTPEEFVREFEDGHFPLRIGPWISFDAHDPPFLMRDLDQMRRDGLIVLDKPARRFCLTLKASDTRESA